MLLINLGDSTAACYHQHQDKSQAAVTSIVLTLPS